MKVIVVVLLLMCCPLVAQVSKDTLNTSNDVFLIIKGDEVSITKEIELDEVIVFPKLKFTDLASRNRYLRLHRKVLKVYPYAEMAATKLDSLTTHLKTLKKKRHKKRYAKKVQRFIEAEFSEELKKMTRTEGQILIKLIHRQTGETAFNLIKELRNGWRAFWFNTTANMFSISLKREFKPDTELEDFLIEDILQHLNQFGLIRYKKAAFPVNYLELRSLWNKRGANF